MKAYNWTMTVRESEALREQIALLESQIRELDERYDAATKSDKAGITREKKQLEAKIVEIDGRLGGAPPKPVAESEIIALLLAELEKYQANFAGLQQKFLEGALGNPAEAIRWNAEDLLVAQEMYRVVHRAMKHKVEWTLDDIAEVCEEVKDEAEREVRSYDPLNYSTCAFSNLVKAAQYKAHAELLGDSFSGIDHVLKMIGRYEEAVAAWRQLQVEIASLS